MQPLSLQACLESGRLSDLIEFRSTAFPLNWRSFSFLGHNFHMVQRRRESKMETAFGFIIPN